jgi:hypothetical protein
MAGNADRRRFLAIYLEDHLAVATVGVEVARRLLGSNEGDGEMGPPLGRICEQLEADREALVEVMGALAAKPSRLKCLGAVAGERLGRLKLNGRLLGYSPLSRVVELEVLGANVGANLSLWRALGESVGEELAGHRPGALAERAESQLAEIEKLHRLAIGRALPAPAQRP